MAHSCPDCGQVCYCNGDIDDCLFDDTGYEVRCRHCRDNEDEEACEDSPSDIDHEERHQAIEPFGWEFCECLKPETL